MDAIPKQDDFEAAFKNSEGFSIYWCLFVNDSNKQISVAISAKALKDNYENIHEKFASIIPPYISNYFENNKDDPRFIVDINAAKIDQIIKKIKIDDSFNPIVKIGIWEDIKGLSEREGRREEHSSSCPSQDAPLGGWEISVVQRYCKKDLTAQALTTIIRDIAKSLRQYAMIIELHDSNPAGSCAWLITASEESPPQFKGSFKKWEFVHKDKNYSIGKWLKDFELSLGAQNILEPDNTRLLDGYLSWADGDGTFETWLKRPSVYHSAVSHVEHGVGMSLNYESKTNVITIEVAGRVPPFYLCYFPPKIVEMKNHGCGPQPTILLSYTSNQDEPDKFEISRFTRDDEDRDDRCLCGLSYPEHKNCGQQGNVSPLRKACQEWILSQYKKKNRNGENEDWPLLCSPATYLETPKKGQGVTQISLPRVVKWYQLLNKTFS